MGIALRSPAARRVAAIVLLAPSIAAGTCVAAAAASAPRAQDAGATVEALVDNKFNPAEITIAPGGSVTWANKGGAHTVTGGDGTTPDPASPVGNSNLFDATATVTKTFEAEGSFSYYCIPHAALGMKGVVIVKAGGATAASATPTATPAAAAPTSAPATAAPADPEAGEKALARLDARMAKQDKTLDKFRLGLWGATGLMVALGVGVYLSTRSSAQRASEG